VVLVQELSRSQEFYGRCCVTFDLLTSKSNQFSSGSQWRMSDGKTSRGGGGNVPDSLSVSAMSGVGASVIQQASEMAGVTCNPVKLHSGCRRWRRGHRRDPAIPPPPLATTNKKRTDDIVLNLEAGVKLGTW